MKRRNILILLVLLIILGVMSFNFWLNYQIKQPFIASKAEEEELQFYLKDNNWFQENLKKPQIIIDGQKLDSKVQYMLEQSGDSDQNQSFLRKMFAVPLGRKYLRYRVDGGWTVFTKETPAMKKTHDLKVTGRGGHDIPIRIYVPEHNSTQRLPVLIYAHGGGYLFASIKALDRAVQLMANEAKVIVVSVDYRLAPEHPYPAASEDGEDVFLWTKNNIAKYNGNAELIAFGGDSAGGHVAVNVAQKQMKNGKSSVAMLLLYYPATGLPTNDRSYKLYAKGFGLDRSFFEFLLTQVFPGKELNSAHIDEFMAPDLSVSLKGMPPAILSTAGFDILKDSGARFAQKLQSDSVQVDYFNYSSLPHSFLQYSGVVPDAEVAASETARLFGERIRTLN